MGWRDGVVLLLLAAATSEVKYFRYETPLTGVTKAGQTCVALDAWVYAHAAPGLADLRLDRDKQETPYAIRETAPLEQQQREVAPLNLGHKGVHTTFEAEMPQGRYSDL